MKINRKALKLIDKGLSSKTVSKLTESQIDTLYSRMISEQTMVSKTDTATIDKLKTEKKPFQVYEKELEEDDDFDLDADQAYTGQQGSHDEYQAADDGMDDDTSPENHDSKMIGMSEEKDNQPNPWAICHAQVGPKKTRKFERCVMSVKKQLEEGKNPVSLFLETQIEKIVEKHIPPRITKSDLLKIVKESTKGSEPSKPGIAPTYPKPGPTKKRETKEQATAPAPAKPATEPTTRPSTTPKEKPFSPGKNPAPAVKPAPKAGKISPDTAKEKVIDIIMNILEK
jgi:hypothetical protein